jgi:predicted CopG family antitoxin
MPSIEIDFEVYKQLTVRRAREDHSYNDVIRELLGLPRASDSSSGGSHAGGASDDWVVKGVRFPAGTQFRGHYKGRLLTGRVENGRLVVNGNSFSSPSAAAMSQTSGAVNGWTFWEFCRPGKSTWAPMTAARDNDRARSRRRSAS